MFSAKYEKKIKEENERVSIKSAMCIFTIEKHHRLAFLSMINDHFVKFHHQMEEVLSNNFVSRKSNTTICQAKTGKHDCLNS